MTTQLLETINAMLEDSFERAAQGEDFIWETALLILPNDPRNLSTNPLNVTGILPPVVWIYAAGQAPSHLSTAGPTWIQVSQAIPPGPAMVQENLDQIAYNLCEGIRQQRTSMLGSVIEMQHNDNPEGTPAPIAPNPNGTSKSGLILPGSR